MREPATIEIGGEQLDTARLLTVGGVKLSLSDIRTRIVFYNWNNPNVIYGFWRSTIGGPSLQREAFNADNVSELLDLSASEFVNSLRGTKRRGDLLLTSEIYKEAALYYFSDIGDDLRAHLTQYAEEDVSETLERTDGVSAATAVPDIADLAGGMREPSTTPVTINGRAGLRMSPSIARVLQARSTELRELGRDRLGTVRVQLSSDTDQVEGTTAENGEVQ